MTALALWLNAPFTWGLFLTVSAVNVLVGTLFQLLALPFDRDRRTALWANRVFWGQALFAVEPGWPTRRLHLERLVDGPCIVVANHSSVLDIPLLFGLPLPLRVVAKRSLLRVPVMGTYMRWSRMIGIDRDGSEASTRAGLEACTKSLESGISLLMFPEGTRSEDGRLGRFHRGAFRLAKDHGVPIVPVVIRGTQALFPKGAPFPQRLRHPLSLEVLEPLDPAQFSTARKLSSRTHAAMAAALDAEPPTPSSREEVGLWTS